MTKEAVYSKLEKILKEMKGKDFKVSPQLSVLDELADDSVELMEFVVTVEEDFQIMIPDDVIDSFVTLDDVAVYISENK